MPITAKPLTKRTKFTAAVNPQAKRKAIRKKSGAPRRNPSTVLLGYLNPEKRQMTKTKKKKQIRRTVKRNPFVVKAKARNHKGNHRPRRRNGSLKLGLINRPIELIKAGAFGAIAYFLTRQIPQMALKARNVSWVGYLANLLTALGCAGVAGKYFGPAAGQSAFVGGGMYLFGRVLNDQTPYGASLALSGIGDPAASPAGLRGMVPGTFLSPMTVDRAGNPVFPPALTSHIQAQIPAPAAARAGVSGGRFGNRFAA